jgi:alkylation response protein AidB-like acyl-CoA dehydrogenase
MHGGVGFTWEYDVHLYFKRAKASELMLGTASEHLETLAGLLLDNDQSAHSTQTKGAAA